MKTMIKFSSLFLLGLAAFLMAASAQAVKPESYAFSEVTEGEYSFDCAELNPEWNFWWVSDYTYSESGHLHYNKDGYLVRVNGFSSFTEIADYNSSDPSKRIPANAKDQTPHHYHFVVLFDETGQSVYYKETGIYYKITVPGYGNLTVDSGMLEYQWNGAEWVLTKITKKRPLDDEELYAVCAFLQ